MNERGTARGAKGGGEPRGRPRDATKAKAAVEACDDERRDCGRRARGRADEPAGGRKQAPGRRYKEGGGSVRALLLHFQGRELRPGREGVSWTLEQGLQATAPNLPDLPVTRSLRDGRVGKGSKIPNTILLTRSLTPTPTESPSDSAPAPRPRLGSPWAWCMNEREPLAAAAAMAAASVFRVHSVSSSIAAVAR